MANAFREKSDQTWQEGNQCLGQGMANSAASRLYYAVFQAVKGFGVAHGDMTMEEGDRVHAKIIGIVTTHGKGRFWAREKLTDLLGLRVKADYTPETVDAEELKTMVGDADKIRKHFIALAGR